MAHPLAPNGLFQLCPVAYYRHSMEPLHLLSGSYHHLMLLRSPSSTASSHSREITKEEGRRTTVEKRNQQTHKDEWRHPRMHSTGTWACREGWSWWRSRGTWRVSPPTCPAARSCTCCSKPRTSCCTSSASTTCCSAPSTSPRSLHHQNPCVSVWWSLAIYWTPWARPEEVTDGDGRRRLEKPSSVGNNRMVMMVVDGARIDEAEPEQEEHKAGDDGRGGSHGRGDRDRSMRRVVAALRIYRGRRSRKQVPGRSSSEWDGEVEVSQLRP